MTVPTVPPARPTSTHGRRIPSGEVVRSESRPNTGFPTTATSDPRPATTARLFGALSPTSASSLSAKVTTSGAMSMMMTPV